MRLVESASSRKQDHADDDFDDNVYDDFGENVYDDFITMFMMTLLASVVTMLICYL